MPEPQTPENLPALDPKVTADNGGTFSALLQPAHRPVIADIGDAPTKEQFNSLLAALRTVGIIKAS